jgi:hypothetical protein
MDSVLIGTAIIKECSDEQNADGNYEWSLIEPERLRHDPVAN